MSTAQSSYVIAMNLESLATSIGDTTPYDILENIVGIEISEEDADDVKRKLNEMRDFMGMDRR